MAVRKLFLESFLLVAVFMFGAKSDGQCDIEIENTLRTLLAPQETLSLQVQALRRDLLKRLQEALEQQEEEALVEYKRSISSLAQYGNLPGKRNLEALARGGYIKTQPENEEEDDANAKRSYANLVKNGALPVNVPNGEGKRGIQSLARNGDLHRKRQLQELIDELYEIPDNENTNVAYTPNYYYKRYLGSIKNGKRNIASIAREGIKVSGKRTLPGALLRQDSYLTAGDKQRDDLYDKRNIASIKAQYKPKFDGRKKRDVSYYDPLSEEYSSPVYQNQNTYDYEDLMKVLTGSYPDTEKRFLGSVARSGWFRSPSSSLNDAYASPEKRHIGALARIGWLPSFRTVRRFNRSGRSASYEDSDCRKASSDGQTQDDGLPESSISLEDKRHFFHPTVDRVLMRKYFVLPRIH